MVAKAKPSMEASLTSRPNKRSDSAVMVNISSLGVPRIVGYSLLLMTVMNWVDILFPSQFMEPNWELQTVGAIVESVPLLLFALVLILYGEGLQRNNLEKILVRILSQACLLMALCFFLLIPLAANSTIRINQLIDAQTGNVFGQQMAQIDQLEDQITQYSNQEIVNILESQELEMKTDQSVPPKDQLLEYLTEARKNIQDETNATRSRRKRSTMKSAFKWMIGAVISGFALVYLWLLTRWARLPRRLNASKGKK